MDAMNLFKGKRVDNGEWVIGNLIFSEDALDGWEAIIIPTTNSNMYASDKDDTNKGDIHFENWYRVDKDTVCRCTGKRELPSVGIGAILRDLIDCGIVPCCQLEKTFRQDNASTLFENIQIVKKGC